MKTVQEQNIIQPKRTKTKKRSKMLRWTESNNINKKGPRLSKLRKIFTPAPPSLQPPLRSSPPPPDTEIITAHVVNFYHLRLAILWRSARLYRLALPMEQRHSTLKQQ